MVDRVERALSAFQKIDGMLGLLDASVIVSLLEYQDHNSIRGPIAEFGVYKGRSAALLASYVRDDEELFLVDIAAYLEQDMLKEINPNFTFLKMDSAKFIGKTFKGRPEKKFRFLHADGSHTFDNVYHDMANADALLSDDGIFVIDDYYNPHYPQVAAAVFTFLERENTDLSMFLVGSNKCYICRKPYYKKIRVFLLNDFQDFMSAHNVPVQLSKTDAHKQFDSFSFKAVPKGVDLDKHYGTKLYGRFYRL